jgi:ketosteroid isomerase-like protein
VPRQEDESKKEVAAAENAFHQAVLAADAKKLESLLDETFTWTDRTGEQTTRQQLLDALRSGQLKYSKLETSHLKMNVYGDAAVVRGESLRQRSSFPGAEKSGDPSPFTAFYTLTFVNKDNDWKAVAMHSTQP